MDLHFGSNQVPDVLLYWMRMSMSIIITFGRGDSCEGKTRVAQQILSTILLSTADVLRYGNNNFSRDLTLGVSDYVIMVLPKSEKAKLALTLL